MLALAGDLSRNQGCHGGVQGHEERPDAGQGDADHHRPVAVDGGPGGMEHLLRLEADARLHQGVVPRPVRQGTVGAVAGDRGVHQPGITGADRLVVDPQPGSRAGAEALHQDVGPVHQPQQRIEGLGPLEVEGDALLAPVPDQLPGQVAPSGATGRVDLHDLGPIVGQHHAHQGAGHAVAEIEDPDAFQRAAHGFTGLLMVSRTLAPAICSVNAAPLDKPDANR